MYLNWLILRIATKFVDFNWTYLFTRKLSISLLIFSNKKKGLQPLICFLYPCAVLDKREVWNLKKKKKSWSKIQCQQCLNILHIFKSNPWCRKDNGLCIILYQNQNKRLCFGELAKSEIWCCRQCFFFFFFLICTSPTSIAGWDVENETYICLFPYFAFGNWETKHSWSWRWGTFTFYLFFFLSKFLMQIHALH